MKDKDQKKLWESYSTHRSNLTEASGDGGAEARYDEPYRNAERAKFGDPAHRQLQQKMQADYDAKQNQSDFSTDPEDENYDKVTHLLDQLVSAELDYNSDSEEEAVSSLIARLMEHPSYIGNDSAVGSPPNDGRFPRGE